jgi:excisionase family DNA binding protein
MIEAYYEGGDILTTRVVAEVLAVSTRTVGHWADAGMLPCLRTIGGHQRYRWADVKRWLNRGGVAAP